MKKYLLSAVILLAALTVQAQKSVKITPTLKVGMQKTYITRAKPPHQARLPPTLQES